MFLCLKFMSIDTFGIYIYFKQCTTTASLVHKLYVPGLFLCVFINDKFFVTVVYYEGLVINLKIVCQRRAMTQMLWFTVHRNIFSARKT